MNDDIARLKERIIETESACVSLPPSPERLIMQNQVMIMWSLVELRRQQK